MEHRFAGPRTVELVGLTSGTRDLTNNKWMHQVYICCMISKGVSVITFLNGLVIFYKIELFLLSNR